TQIPIPMTIWEGFIPPPIPTGWLPLLPIIGQHPEALAMPVTLYSNRATTECCRRLGMINFQGNCAPILKTLTDHLYTMLPNTMPRGKYIRYRNHQVPQLPLYGQLIITIIMEDSQVYCGLPAEIPPMLIPITVLQKLLPGIPNGRKPTVRDW